MNEGGFASLILMLIRKRESFVTNDYLNNGWTSKSSSHYYIRTSKYEDPNYET